MARQDSNAFGRAVAWLSGRRPASLTPEVAAYKQAGAEIARAAYASGLAGPGFKAPPDPELIRLGGQLCRQADIEAPWLHHWCHRLGMAPLYHRKVWEECFATQALWEAGMLAPGRRGLGFAVGRELLPSFLAAQGASVLATDLHATDDRARGWHRTGQHAGNAAHLFHRHLVKRAEFDALVRFQPVDMTAIPTELRLGGFDFLWSVCSLEHLGSLAAGMDFVVAAMECLKPGGVAVHTTEYNLNEAGRTIARGNTVLYQRRHIEALGDRLAAAGHRMLPVDFSLGGGVLDGFVDLPPFSDATGASVVTDAPHLAMRLRGHPTTSIGFIVRKAGERVAIPLRPGRRETGEGAVGY